MAVFKSLMLLALLCAAACLELRRGEHSHPQVQHGQKKLKQTSGRQSECWKLKPVSRFLTKEHLRFASLLGKKKLPGFGNDESTIVPFVTVMKDGFFPVACVNDRMMTTADKHGDGKWSYTNIANVSVIFYDRIVHKLEQKAMTPEVCYEFCRTVPDAGFFGLANGRKCYCTPYFDTAASDSSTCDSVCEGEPTSMCGGKTKQNIYAMHLCADTAQDVVKAKSTGETAKALCDKVNTPLNTEKTSLDTIGKELKDRAGALGDSATSFYGQHAVEFTSDLDAGFLASQALSADLAGLTGDLAGMTAVDFSDAGTVTAVEDKISETKALADKATEMCSPWEYLTVPTPNNTNSIAAYYPITYWTEEKGTNISTALPSSCKGTPANDPVIVENAAECAAICDSMIQPGEGKCTAFEYYSTQTGNLCVPLNYIDGITFYKKGICTEKAGSDLKCAAKFSLMTGFENRVSSKAADADHVPVKVLDRCF